MISFDSDVENALRILQQGGIILYPTDTIWGLGCDALNEFAIEKIYALKQRPDTKSLIILIAEARDLLQYVAAPEPEVFAYIEEQERPTTIVFQNAIGLPEKLIAPDGSIAIRVVNDPFCRHLIKRLRRPLVSTSANSSGTSTPQDFKAISGDIKNGVDYIVNWRQNDTTPAQPSRLVKWERAGTITVLRS